MKIEGSDMMWFLGGKSIALAKSHKLNITAETVDTSNKDEGGDWDSPGVKKLAFDGNSDSLFPSDPKGNGFDDLFALMIAKTPIDAIFSLGKVPADAGKEVPEGGWTAPTTNGGYKGKVIITNLEINAPNGDKATLSVQFKGVGELKKMETA